MTCSLLIYITLSPPRVPYGTLCYNLKNINLVNQYECLTQNWSLQDLFNESIKIYPLLYFCYSVCSDIIICTGNMNLPCKSCTYSYSLGVYLIYTNIYSIYIYIYIYIIFQTFCFLRVYFKSIFIKTIYNFLLVWWCYSQTTLIYIFQNRSIVCTGTV